jgi:hypothetical protein
MLSQREDLSLAFAPRMRLRIHLAVCEACHNVSRQFQAMRIAMNLWRDSE